MAPHVLHFGQDDCHRLAILRSTGYEIEPCATLAQLAAALRTAHVEAIFLTENESGTLDAVIPEIRAHTSAAIILFKTTNRRTQEKLFDLVIPSLMTPEEWLESVRAVLERKRRGPGLEAVSGAFDRIGPHAERVSARIRHELP